MTGVKSVFGSFTAARESLRWSSELGKLGVTSLLDDLCAGLIPPVDIISEHHVRSALSG